MRVRGCELECERELARECVNVERERVCKGNLMETLSSLRTRRTSRTPPDHTTHLCWRGRTDPCHFMFKDFLTLRAASAHSRCRFNVQVCFQRLVVVRENRKAARQSGNRSSQSRQQILILFARCR